MDVVMLKEVPHESLNGGRTRQTFVQGERYDVPDEIARRWIKDGWAAAPGAANKAPGERHGDGR